MKWLRDNAVLALGMALPLLLMLLFLGVRAAQIGNMPAPVHTAVFAITPYYSNPQPFDLRVQNNGRLSVTFRLDEKREHGADAPETTVYIYNPATQKLDSHTLTAPRDAVVDRTYTIPLPDALSSLSLNADATSADGYHLERSHRGGGNIMTDIFGYSGNYNAHFQLVNGLRRVSISGPFEYGQDKFIGWVKPE